MLFYPSARQIGEKPQISRIFLGFAVFSFVTPLSAKTEVLHNRIEGANVAPKKVLRFFLVRLGDGKGNRSQGLKGFILLRTNMTGWKIHHE